MGLIIRRGLLEGGLLGGMLIGRAVCCKGSLLEVGLIGEEAKWRKGLLTQLISKGRLIGGNTVINKTV